MTETYNIDLFDGHLIFANNGLKVLVDTGSPFSIGKDPHFEFMGQQYHCNEGISTISEMMGYDIDVLMGMDVLGYYYIQTDYKDKKIVFSTDRIPFESICTVPLIRGNMGEVCVELSVNGQKVKLALDTGAKISYIDECFTVGKPVIETREDFSPFIGNFETPIYVIDASLGDQTFPVYFGNLPSQMSSMLKMMGIYGAIGFDLFNAFTILLDFRNNELLLAEIHNKKV